MTDTSEITTPNYRIFCLACAGGGVSHYFRWRRHAKPDVAIEPLCLPGRESRYREPLLTTFNAIVDDLIATVRSKCDVPFVLMGHSMGSLLAYELARRLEQEGQTPNLLITAACHAPDVPPRTPLLHPLSDHDFVSELTNRYGQHGDVLTREESKKVFLPIVRADLKAAETHPRQREFGRLACDIIAVCGDRDPSLSLADVERWNGFSTGDFAHFERPGNHFFVETDRDWLLEIADHRMRQLSANNSTSALDEPNR